jgi:hypothetical protein
LDKRKLEGKKRDPRPSKKRKKDLLREDWGEHLLEEEGGLRKWLTEPSIEPVGRKTKQTTLKVLNGGEMECRRLVEEVMEKSWLEIDKKKQEKSNEEEEKRTIEIEEEKGRLEKLKAPEKKMKEDGKGGGKKKRIPKVKLKVSDYFWKIEPRKTSLEEESPHQRKEMEEIERELKKERIRKAAELKRKCISSHEEEKKRKLEAWVRSTLVERILEAMWVKQTRGDSRKATPEDFVSELPAFWQRIERVEEARMKSEKWKEEYRRREPERKHQEMEELLVGWMFPPTWKRLDRMEARKAPQQEFFQDVPPLWKRMEKMAEAQEKREKWREEYKRNEPERIRNRKHQEMQIFLEGWIFPPIRKRQERREASEKEMEQKVYQHLGAFWRRISRVEEAVRQKGKWREEHKDRIMRQILEEAMFPALWKKVERGQKAKQELEEELTVETLILEHEWKFVQPEGRMEEEEDHWLSPAMWKSKNEVENLRLQLKNWNIWSQKSSQEEPKLRALRRNSRMKKISRKAPPRRVSSPLEEKVTIEEWRPKLLWMEIVAVSTGGTRKRRRGVRRGKWVMPEGWKRGRSLTTVIKGRRRLALPGDLSIGTLSLEEGGAVGGTEEFISAACETYLGVANVTINGVAGKADLSVGHDISTLDLSGQTGVIQGVIHCTDITAVQCEDGYGRQPTTIFVPVTGDTSVQCSVSTSVQCEDGDGRHGWRTSNADTTAWTAGQQTKTEQALTLLPGCNNLTGGMVRDKIELFETSVVRIKKRGRRRKNVGDILGGGLVQAGIRRFTVDVTPPEPSFGTPNLVEGNPKLPGGILGGDLENKLEFLGILDSMKKKRRLSGGLVTPGKKHRKC